MRQLTPLLGQADYNAVCSYKEVI